MSNVIDSKQAKKTIIMLMIIASLHNHYLLVLASHRYFWNKFK